MLSEGDLAGDLREALRFKFHLKKSFQVSLNGLNPHLVFFSENRLSPFAVD
jgi:hypothetical protein